MRKFFGCISVLGLLLFGGAFLLSFAQPVRIEAFAQQLLEREVRERAAASLQAAERSRLGRYAQRLAAQHPAATDALRQQALQRLTPIVEAVIAEMRDPGCPCRAALAARLDLAPDVSLAHWLQGGSERLSGFVRAKYVEVAAALLHEFRIFTAANALMFALLGLAVVLRRQARAQLLPTALLLLATTVIVAYLYLFQQNWLHTLVFGAYVGGFYFVYLGVAGALLADLLFNRARGNTGIVNAVAALFGGAGVAAC